MTALHLDLLRTMLLMRRFDERCADLRKAGRVRDFASLPAGPAAVAAGVCAELHPEDSVVSTYDAPAHALALGLRGCSPPHREPRSPPSPSGRWRTPSRAAAPARPWRMDPRANYSVLTA